MKGSTRISRNIPAPFDNWKEIYDNCDYATYFQSVEFSMAMKQAQPAMRINSRLIEFNDQKKAILLLHQERSLKGLLRFNNSLMFSGYGGWISGDVLTEAHTDLLLDYIRRLNIYLRTNPFDRSNPYQKLKTDPDFAHILDLRKGYDEIYKNYNRNRKRDIVTAQNAGVTFAEANSPEDWQAFYEIYLSALKKWGTNARSRREWIFWESLMNSDTDHVKLYVVKYDLKIIAGVVCLMDKRKITEYHRVFLDEYKHVSPVTYLIDQVIQLSIGKFDYFDFMSSGKMDNIIAFKNSFGPEMVPNDTFFNYTPGFRALQLVQKMARKLFFLNATTAKTSSTHQS
ncbi:MAG: GNAT family N-acetyltransferase [Bacteroidetes bacterium]|nr:GNAT family N-acetyltransferase [Bacteroidota bacterium]